VATLSARHSQLRYCASEPAGWIGGCRVRTDRIDTERLRGSLLAYLRGEPKECGAGAQPCRRAWGRWLHRQRDRLVSRSARQRYRLWGLQGICDYNPLRHKRWRGSNCATLGGASSYKPRPRISQVLIAAHAGICAGVGSNPRPLYRDRAEAKLGWNGFECSCIVRPVVIEDV
jgi:hypothetical protein